MHFFPALMLVIYLFIYFKPSDGEFSVRTHLLSLRQGGELRRFLSYVHFTLNQMKSQLQKELKYIGD